MSNQRYDVLSARKYQSGGEERTDWSKVGVAFETKGGDGFNVKLHVVPVGQDGVINLLIKAARPRDDQPPPSDEPNSGAPF